LIVFPDHNVAGRRSIPFVTVSLAAVLLIVQVAGLVSGLPFAIPPTVTFVSSLLFLVIVGGATEFALGRWVFLFSLLISALTAVGLPLLVLELRPEGVAWLPLAVATLVGLTAGLFKSWHLRPLYLVPGWLGRIQFPAYLPVMVWVGVFGVLAWRVEAGAEVLLVHLLCGIAGVVLGIAMNALSLIRPSMFTSEYAARVIRKGLAEVDDLLREHRLGPARRLINRLTSLDPNSVELRRSRYAAWKYSPTRPEFHAAAAELLDVQETDADANRMVEEIFRDYMAVTQGKPELPIELHLALAQRFALNQNVEYASNIINVHMQRNIQHPLLPTAILTLAEGYVLTGKPARAMHYAETLLALFPNTAEARSAKTMTIRLASQLPSSP
jgi:hypothetical protein